MWNLQDKEDYVQHLRKELRDEKKNPESIARLVNINNLNADINSIDLTH